MDNSRFVSRENTMIGLGAFPPASSGPAETTIEPGFSASKAVTNGITEDCAVAATMTAMRPPGISVGAPQPKAAWEGLQGVSLSICARTMASRKPAACRGSSRDRNTNRRLAKTISICPRASRDRTRAPASSTNCPSTKRSRAPTRARRSPFHRLDEEMQILLLDDLEFSRRPKNSADRQDRRRYVVNPARQPQR